MNYRHLALRCNCGDVPERIEEVGFTDDHLLVIHWWCSQCQKVVYLTKPLAECWRDCPRPEDSMERRLEELEKMRSAEDASFLRSVGVKAS